MATASIESIRVTGICTQNELRLLLALEITAVVLVTPPYVGRRVEPFQ